WYEVNAPLSGTPTLVQQGDINLGPAISTSFPSIAINSSDTIGMTFLENGGGQATSMYVTGRVATDSPNTMQTPLLVKAGVLPATNMVLDENIFNRGGAYSAIEFDPSNPADFWSANMFQFDSSGKNFDWGTQVAQYLLVPGPAVTATSNQTATEGIGQSFSLGSLTDSASGPWMVTVNWGDSTTTTTFGTSSQGTIPSQTHTYLEEGAYTVLVTVTDTMSNLIAAGNFQVSVAMVGSSALSLLQSFAGIKSADTSGSTPPDSMMAVGPNSTVETVNTAIIIKSKDGHLLAGPVEFLTFLSGVVANGDVCAEPQLLYDDQAGVFYLCVLEYAYDALGHPDISHASIDLAASKTSNPTSLGNLDWTLFARITSVTEGGTEFPDVPKLGWNKDAVFVSTNQFSQNFQSYDHNLILAISKASILGGGPLVTHQTVVSSSADRHILIPARMHNESSGNLEYFVQSLGGASSTMVNVLTETGYLSGAGTFSSTPLSVNPYNNSPGVAGLTGQMDDRILSVDWIDNGSTQHLVASGNVGEGGVNLARWYEVNAPLSGTPTLVQQGDINLGPAISTSFPSIAINSSDTIGMTFLENGGGQATSMYVTGRVATDPPNTMEDEVLVQAGVLPATDPLRGGDFSATEFDPSKPANFWSTNEFQFDNSGSNFNWGTQIAEYTFNVSTLPLQVLPPANQSAMEGTSLSVILGAFTDSGSGPWTASVAWGDGTSIMLPAPSAPGLLGNQSHAYAEEGTYTVTVTVNDTGSNTSASAMFTVSVAELNVVATPAGFSLTAGAPFSGAVATFMDPGGAEANDGSHYSASINWGDNSAAAIGSISLNGSTFSVNGTHTYAAANSYSITVTISHEGNPILVQSQVMVVSLGQFVSAGMVKPISFWEGLQGQQLVRRFGTTGDGRTLGQWLATTYPNLYGGMGGAPNLSPFTLAQISSYYQSLFLASKGTGLDAEVLATVLEVFATTSSLGGSVGQSFGFTVTNTGLGAESWNIGSSGQAFGVPNLTVLNVYQILLAANNSAVGGEPWGSNPLFRNEAFSVFHGINGG
ncbi:MAG TPA: PKD domain-containing protein, partial [Gemmataceae bacterium]|nr:PKD domain-containing protein [Gemmataceae bacterium]